MIVQAVECVPSATGFRLVAAGRAETARTPEFTVRFEFSGRVEPSEAIGDTWVAALLLPAMFAGEALEVRAPVSRPLFENLETIQEILLGWYPQLLRRIEVRAPELCSAKPRPAAGRAALFFSGGVDSWYSLHKHRGNVRALITAKGFDIPYRDEQVWTELDRSQRAITGELGLELVTVATDLRDFLDPVYGHFSRPCLMDFWGNCMHGACLAAAGLALKGFDRLLIASSWPYIRLQPWGTHPLLDPLWSNGQTEFVHDGCEAGRIDKLRVVSRLDLALAHLRVCSALAPGRYNCCECEKCRRTMLTLRLYGALDRARTFDRPLDFKAMELAQVRPEYRVMYRDILREAEAVGDAEVARLARILSGETSSLRRRWACTKSFFNRALAIGSRAKGGYKAASQL